jgi:hypothetical protein
VAIIVKRSNERFREKNQQFKSLSFNGILEMINNENSYINDVEVSYSKDDNFRVSLTNQK